MASPDEETPSDDEETPSDDEETPSDDGGLRQPNLRGRRQSGAVLPDPGGCEGNHQAVEDTTVSQTENPKKRQPSKFGCAIACVGPWVALGLILVLMVSCVQIPARTLRLDGTDAGRTVELPVGGKMDVVLDTSPATGYYWEVMSVNVSILMQVGKPDFEPDPNATAPSGKRTFHFEAVKPGKTLLRLVYHRTWEESTIPADTFQVMVVVK